ncbi:major capsid protein [Pseudomonas phage phiK7A1]|uniref:Major capsid protein n=1 Tax=Pseudomonas phage phiK7A1 TaxID=2759194 RepID=A0A7H0XFR8_9CAUD|nr:major capsid protein [Pseudomonas phage phiK7A1]
MSQVQIAKAATRSFASTATSIYEYTDLSHNLMIIPNVWSLSEQLGIFNTDTTNMGTITIEEITSGFGLIKDVHRGARHTVSMDATRRMHAFALPHFTLDDAITPQDVQGKRAYGADVLETVAAVKARKMETIRKSWAATHEKARWHTIVTGTSYAPNATTQYDWYAQFGQTRKVIDFQLNTSTTDLMAKTEEVFAYIQDNSEDGQVRSEIYGVASPEFFAKLIAHPTLKALYLAYQQSPNILQERLRAAGFDARYRSFTVGNITYIEYRGVGPDGVRYIPVGDVYFLPADKGDNFTTYYGPADHFDYINTQGQEMYAFEYGDNRGQMIEIQTESNFIDVLRRPQLIVRGTVGA